MSTGIVTLKPLGDRIVLKRLPQEEKTAGGIFLPDTAQEKPMKGEVVAVGPGKTLESGEKTRMEVEIGQVVLFGKYSGNEVKIDGEDFTILEQREILGVFVD
ncbi:MAG: co-chaperone GroES [Candidatus Xenobium sp.]|jgi:chaperonin GroES|nr:co-chaperone GroES [Burkholderiales bacterium]